ncbi:JM16 [macacine gammaherpesvirus 11]|uniref:JM16 n=2 Tax=macacine gammaherpesvirus 11 TaxID=2560570 RepID=G9JMJ4_9GAMA|nr:JM16 [Macaca fuscata rhadinovirus]AAS99993.1 JM16 [Macaca fuscata rhadinovirus]AEW87541.1 JM16 [Macaca fuscata rhadinovirus]AEW87711.1 JM16 [Macaca fuscata rhadinovirus]
MHRSAAQHERLVVVRRQVGVQVQVSSVYHGGVAQVVRLDDAWVQAGKIDHQDRLVVKPRDGVNHRRALITPLSLGRWDREDKVIPGRGLQQAGEHAKLLAVR